MAQKVSFWTNLGHFDPFSPSWDSQTYWKWTNGAVSGIKTFKFEFSSLEYYLIDLTYETLEIFRKKKPPKGVFVALKSPSP